MMQNPLEMPIPETPIEQVTAFARDFAYGVYLGWWQPDFNPDVLRKFGISDYANLRQKWASSLPEVTMLVIMGYARPYRFVDDSLRARFIITQEALKLLDAPARPPSVFIAYGREQSSAFALLVEEKLKARGASVFIDKVLAGGDEWQSRIERTLREQIDTFICLIAPGSLDRPNLQNEIFWAGEVNRILSIPVWHRGFTYNADAMVIYDSRIRDFIEKKNAIRVLEESAREYEAALSQLLNQLQYAGEGQRLFS